MPTMSRMCCFLISTSVPSASPRNEGAEAAVKEAGHNKLKRDLERDDGDRPVPAVCALSDEAVAYHLPLVGTPPSATNGGLHCGRFHNDSDIPTAIELPRNGDQEQHPPGERALPHDVLGTHLRSVCVHSPLLRTLGVHHVQGHGELVEAAVH